MIICLIYLIFNNIDQLLGLIELPPVPDNDILKTEAIIRATANNIFTTLRLNSTVKERTRLKYFTTVHNYLVLLTLRDHRTLTEVAKLTRVSKIVASENNFTIAINELLNEPLDENDTKANADEKDVLSHIEAFLLRLHNLKEKYKVDNYKHLNNKLFKFIKYNESEMMDSNIIMPESFSDSDSDENNTIIDDNEYWVPSGRRIFRGKNTKIKNFPFMASVHVFGQFTCAGCIIKSDLIITACSCLQLAYNNRFFRENPRFLSVRVGSNFYTGGGEVIPVLEVYFHPMYDPRSLRNNLAVMRLERRIRFGRRYKKVKKILFDRQANVLPMTTDGITIVGWGAQTTSNVIKNPWTNKLSFAVLDVYGLEDCQDIYSKEYVTKQHFCAGFISHGGGACNRDLGGPGIANGLLAGIVSFGSPQCGSLDSPTVFTKLGYYAKWIDDIMEMDVPMTLKKTTLRTRKEYKIPKIVDESTTEMKILPVDIAKTYRPPTPEELEKDLRMGNAEEQFFKDFFTTIFGSKETDENGLVLRQDVYASDKDNDEIVTIPEQTTDATTDITEDEKKFDKAEDNMKYKLYFTRHVLMDVDTGKKVTKPIQLANAGPQFPISVQTQYSPGYTVMNREITNVPDQEELSAKNHEEMNQFIENLLRITGKYKNSFAEPGQYHESDSSSLEELSKEGLTIESFEDLTLPYRNRTVSAPEVQEYSKTGDAF